MFFRMLISNVHKSVIVINPMRHAFPGMFLKSFNNLFIYLASPTLIHKNY